jgi:hypothetical protein
MREDMSNFHSQFYGMSIETAAEVVSELKDKRSLARLVGFRGDARAASLTPHFKA